MLKLQCENTAVCRYLIGLHSLNRSSMPQLKLVLFIRQCLGWFYNLIISYVEAFKVQSLLQLFSELAL